MEEKIMAANDYPKTKDRVVNLLKWMVCSQQDEDASSEETFAVLWESFCGDEGRGALLATTEERGRKPIARTFKLAGWVARWRPQYKENNPKAVARCGCGCGSGCVSQHVVSSASGRPGELVGRWPINGKVGREIGWRRRQLRVPERVTWCARVRCSSDRLKW